MKPLACSLLLACSAACAQPVVSDAWFRPTVQGQSAGGGFLRIDNSKGPADRLVGASAPVAASTELHSMTLEGDLMRMRRLDAIDIPAGGSVELKPGGLHLMLVGVKAPLQPGTRFPLLLRFEKAGEVQTQAQVAARPPGGAHEHHDHHHHK